ncbi:cobalamin biosynthesis protein [Nocardia wallacei]|uniref:cobalamin biosynthesis protein n=1 Tax=Nocardia wallacei TaxID=480035 RepID=UPI0024587356|nr:cobalamin biosynthesis protein [Nocardia wallacei]
MGFRPGAEAAVIVAAVREVVGGRWLRCLATVERRAGEQGLIGAAEELGVAIVAFPAERLAAVQVPNPLCRTATAVGTPSVAEAAALCAAADGELLVPKRVLRGITVALAR